jgi:flavin-binding protein dodecin
MAGKLTHWSKVLFPNAAWHYEFNKNKESFMSIARTTEITSSSSKSFEEAIKKGISRYSKTIDNVEGAWIKEQKVVVKNGDISEYRVTMKVSFILKD